MFSVLTTFNRLPFPLTSAKRWLRVNCINSTCRICNKTSPESNQLIKTQSRNKYCRFIIVVIIVGVGHIAVDNSVLIPLVDVNWWRYIKIEPQCIPCEIGSTYFWFVCQMPYRKCIIIRSKETEKSRNFCWCEENVSLYTLKIRVQPSNDIVCI